VLAYVNGQYIPADRPALSVNDRSFLYGDGLFETIRITNGQPFLWREHLERLQRGAEFLKIPLPSAFAEIEHATRHLLVQNDTPEGVVRIHLSRGPSERGYALPSNPHPTLVITTHKFIHVEHPELKLITSTIRVLTNDSLAQHKTANRLPNILARAEADAAGADEALLLNDRNQIAEASAANIFILRGRELITPPLSAGALAGTTRAFILKIAPAHNLTPLESPLATADIHSADATFLTSSHRLITAAASLDSSALATTAASTVKTLRAACERTAQGA
jgi:branched-chain amino acid aminotransferase